MRLKIVVHESRFTHRMGPASSPRRLLLRDAQRHSRLIRLATYPAPKPLSIFTTVTFDAQLFSIPSKAAIPFKLAP